MMEVNKSYQQIIQLLDSNQTTSVPNDFEPHKSYGPYRAYEWTKSGRPICRKCSEVGHIAKDCRTGTPYQRLQQP